MSYLWTKLWSKLLVQFNNHTKTHKNIFFIIRLQQPQSIVFTMVHDLGQTSKLQFIYISR